MGISVGSATVAAAAKSAKDAQGVTQQAGVLPKTTPQVQSPALTRLTAAAPVGSPAIKPHFAQVFLQEEGTQIDQLIDVSKFQNFFFTLALGIAYVALVCHLSNPGYPKFEDASGQGHILWLLGLSHAGYVGGKLVPKT